MKKLLEDDESLNPMLSVTNLVDVFLVIIATLLVAIAQNPLNPFTTDNVTVIKNSGEPNMEVIIKDGEKIMHYKSTGKIGQGQGARAGVTYKMQDGSMIYVPEN